MIAGISGGNAIRGGVVTFRESRCSDDGMLNTSIGNGPGVDHSYHTTAAKLGGFPNLDRATEKETAVTLWGEVCPD